MFDNAEYKNDRRSLPSTLAPSAYNMIIGITLLWGFIVDTILCFCVGDKLLDWCIANDWGIWVVIIGYFVVSLGSIAVIYKSDEPIVSFLGFTVLALAMGTLLTIVIPLYTGGTILVAMIITAAVTLLMTIAATIKPEFFKSIGRGLLVALIIMIIVDLISLAVMLFFGLYSGAVETVIDLVFVGIFSLYIGYDYAKAQDYGRTLDSAIDSAADIYIDIINLFIRILAILGRKK